MKMVEIFCCEDPHVIAFVELKKEPIRIGQLCT